MEEQSNITFRVIKQGIMANANFTILVNGKSVGKINFKKELTLPFQKGIYKIQFKVGFMTTKELKVNVDGNNKVIEWIYGNNTEPYIVGEENTKIENTTDTSLNDLNKNNQSLNSKKAKKPKNALIIMLVIIIGIVGGITLSNVFDSGYTNNATDKTTSPETRAKMDALQLISVEYKYYLNSSYSIGKITRRNAVLDSKSGEWYLFKCTYSYNPLNGAGSTMLDREQDGQVYVGIKLNGDDTFKYKFGRTLDDLKTKLNQ